MDISNRQVVQTLRVMAWERAKGELLAMLHASWPEYRPRTGEPIDNGFSLMNEKVTLFIKDFEDTCV
jgi:hypothetical protein